MMMKSPKVGRYGFTRVELLVVIVALAVLAGFILPWYANAKRKRERIRCVSNLKQIGLGFRLSANDGTASFPWQISTNRGGAKEWASSGEVFRLFQAAANEIGNPQLLVCPSDRERIPANTFGLLGNTNLSYFIGIEAAEHYPNSILLGDRNVSVNGQQLTPGPYALTTNLNLGWSSTQHKYAGNIGFADGSVQQVSNSRLRQVLAGTGAATNWVAIP